MTDLVGIATRPGLAILTLNRPERRNALSIALLDALLERIAVLEADASTRVVILRGDGPVFSAGLDLTEAADAALAEPCAQHVAKTLHTIRHSRLVFIAAVHGGAYAGGAGLAAACDMTVLAAEAKIGFPEARRGLLPALVCEVLREKVRAGDLAELFLAGEPIDAARVQAIGLAQRVVPASRLLDEALAMADSTLAGGPRTIALTKALLRRTYAANHEQDAGSPLAEHLAARNAPEATEGLRAFLEKRSPRWST
jgi:methylglutaconyl-CoA hydratase